MYELYIIAAFLMQIPDFTSSVPSDDLMFETYEAGYVPQPPSIVSFLTDIQTHGGSRDGLRKRKPTLSIAHRKRPAAYLGPWDGQRCLGSVRNRQDDPADPTLLTTVQRCGRHVSEW